MDKIVSVAPVSVEESDSLPSNSVRFVSNNKYTSEKINTLNAILK
jgi:hypothetical protein